MKTTGMQGGILFFTLTFVLQTVLTGCGSHGTDPEAPPVLQEKAGFSVARKLGLQLLSNTSNTGEYSTPWNEPEKTDAKSPSDLSNDIADDATFDGNTIYIHKKLFLRDEHSPNPDHKREHFFVWPENSLGFPITTVSYNHRVLNGKGQWIGDLRSKRAWHDVAEKRWFIPVRELFQDADYGEMDASLQETQVLTLEMSQIHGPNINVQIQFQAVGPLPAVKVSSVTREVSGSIEKFVGGWSTGWLLREEKLVNPTSRTLDLWVKSDPESTGLKLNTYLKYPSYQKNDIRPPSGPFWNNRVSVAALSVNLLEVIRPIQSQDSGKTMQSEKYALNSEWTKIEMKPYEVLDLKWWAKPANPNEHCGVPEGYVVTLNWMEPAPTTFTRWNLLVEGEKRNPYLIKAGNPFPDPPGPSTPMASTFDIEWRISGIQIQGKWQRVIRLTHPFSKPGSEETEFLIPAAGFLEESFSAGEIPPEASALSSCQGFFR